LPPLIFTVLVQNNVDQKYGVIAVSFGFAVAVLLLSCTASWDEILTEVGNNKELHFGNVEDIENDIVPTRKEGRNEEISM
jgi:hypothetical protein